MRPVEERERAAGTDAEERRHRRGLKFRKREDYAVELFREAQANLGDRARLSRILHELGRFYNPYIDAPIVDLATQKRIVEHVEQARPAEATRLLEQRLALYARSDQADEE